MTTSTPRAVAKAGRDRLLRGTPSLQRTICSLARRGRLSPRIWRRLHPIGEWTLHAPDGTPFRYASDYDHDRLARHIVWTDMRHWESSTQPVLYRLARTARVFVDVGAYSGVYTLLACTANPQLTAVACEPNPAKVAQLTANLRLNGLTDRVEVVAKALSSRGGRATLEIPTDDSQASLAAGVRSAERVEVDVTTGDDVLAGRPVDLVKIDVEGLEPEVVAGMAGVLTAHRPTVIAECLDQAALDRLRDAMGRLGFDEVYHLPPGGPVRVGDGFRHVRHQSNYVFSGRRSALG